MIRQAFSHNFNPPEPSFLSFFNFFFVGILHVSCKIVNNTNWHIWNVGVIWVRFLYSSSEIWIYYDYLFWYHDSSTSENFVPVLSKLQQKQERLLYSYKHLIFFPHVPAKEFMHMFTQMNHDSEKMVKFRVYQKYTSILSLPQLQTVLIGYKWFVL